VKVFGEDDGSCWAIPPMRERPAGGPICRLICGIPGLRSNRLAPQLQPRDAPKGANPLVAIPFLFGSSLTAKQNRSSNHIL